MWKSVCLLLSLALCDGFAHGRDSNHRITANATAYQATLTAGWIGEGVVMCRRDDGGRER